MRKIVFALNVTFTHGNNCALQLASLSKLCLYKFLNETVCVLIMGKVLTCITRDSPQDARQAGQRSASPAVVQLQHGQVLVSDVRRNNKILQIPLVDLWNFIQTEFLKQRVLHILMRKSLGETEESGAEDASAEEIHEYRLECDEQQQSSTSNPEIDSVPLTLLWPFILLRPSQSFALCQWGQGPLSEQRCDNTAPF